MFRPIATMHHTPRNFSNQKNFGERRALPGNNGGAEKPRNINILSHLS
jgi:hypothetical protein